MNTATPVEVRTLRSAAGGGLPAWLVNLGLTLLLVVAWFVNAPLHANLDPYFLDVLIRIGVAIILAVSLNLINGITGQFSLGHAGFMALGAYTCGILMRHTFDTNTCTQGFAQIAAFLGATLLAGLIAAIAGLLIGVPALRLRGDYLAIATLGFAEIIVIILNKIEWLGQPNTGWLVGGSAGLHNIPVITTFFWTFTWCVICIVCIWRLVNSGKGRAFLAVREDEIAAAATGIDTTYHKVAAFVVGAFFAGVAGALSATWSGNLAPASFNFTRSVEVVVMVVLGGSGSITGAILAAVVLTWLPEQLRFLESWRMVIYSLILILMMILRPEGLLGNRELWWTRKRISTASKPNSTLTGSPDATA